MPKPTDNVEEASVIALDRATDRKLWPYSVNPYHFKERSEAERFAKAFGTRVIDRRELPEAR